MHPQIVLSLGETTSPGDEILLKYIYFIFYEIAFSMWKSVYGNPYTRKQEGP